MLRMQENKYAKMIKEICIDIDENTILVIDLQHKKAFPDKPKIFAEFVAYK